MATLLLPQTPKPTLEYDPDDPLNRGLVAWFPFRQFETPGGSWNVRNIAALDDNGQIESMAASDWSRAGSPTGGGAWQIQGLNDLLKCGTKLASKLVNQGTFAIWVKKRTDNPSHTYKGGSWKLNTNGLNNHYPYPTGTIYDGTFVTSRQTIGAGLIADHTQWHQVCVTVDTAGTYRFYQNAQEAYSASLTFDPPDSDPWIGCSATAGSYYFDGSFSDVRIYDRALQPKEVMDLYVASKRGYPTQFKRRSFPVSTSEEAVTSGSTAIRLRTPKSTQPSYKAGWAKNAAESSHPNLWDGLVGAWVPQLGVSGSVVRDVSMRGDEGTLNGAVWQPKGTILFDSTNDYIDLGSKVYLTSGEPFSLFWREKITADTNAYPSRFDLDVANSGDTFMALRSNNASYEELTFGKSPGTNASVKASAGVIDPIENAIGDWHSALITGANPISTTVSDWALYWDGTRVGLVQGDSIGAVDVNRIGWDGADHGPDCEMDVVCIWDRRLTSFEASLLHRDSLAPFRQRRSILSSGNVEPTAADSGVIRLRTPKSTAPSYKSGWAKSASESSHPNLWTGLKGAWIFGLGCTGNTEAIDVSGYGAHGTISTGSAEWLTGEVGISSRIVDPEHYQCGIHAHHEVVDDLTVSGWFYPEGGDDRMLAGKCDSIFAGGFEWAHSTTLDFAYYDGAVRGWYKSPTLQVSLSEWQHLATTRCRSSGTITFYVNGVEVGTAAGTTAAITYNGDTLDIGHAHTTNKEYIGSIQSFLLHDRCLTHDEIKTLYRDPMALVRQRRSIPLSQTNPSAITHLSPEGDPGPRQTFAPKTKANVYKPTAISII